MADDYTSGLNEILGNLTSPTPNVQSPEEDIKTLYEDEFERAASEDRDRASLSIVPSESSLRVVG